LVDFGLAKPLYDEAGALKASHEVKRFKGTISYASLEAHNFQVTSSVYSAGAKQKR